MCSVESAALTVRPRKEMELLPRKGILSSEMDRRGWCTDQSDRRWR